MANKNKSPRKKTDDMVVYKAMIDMALVVAALLLLPVISRNYGLSDLENYTAWNTAFRIIAIVCAPLFVASVAAAVLKKGAIRRWAVAGAVVFAVLGLVSLSLYLFWCEPIPYLTFLAIASAALYLVWILYPHDFFLIALLTTAAGGAFYLHHLRQGLTTGMLAAYVILVLMLAAALFLGLAADKHKGFLHGKKRRFRLYSGSAGAKPLYLTVVIWLVCVVASLLAGPVFAYYCVYVAAAYLFVMACYYTIRLN